jgi:phthiocerol/phenolphthiocerol synthesis type-I polyketide synthase E
MSYKTGDYNGSEIAIVGISCRFPGSSNPGQFWENLRDGVESITFLNPEELEPSCIDQANPNDPNYVSAASILCDIELFDAAFFGYLPREAEVMDPQHRLFLECAWEALEDSGTDPKSYGGPIGVFAGARTNTYLFNLFSNREKVGSLGSFEIGLGNDLAFLPARVSYKLDLTGPSYAIHTACSTSLVAVHLACQSLLIAECDMALAGGVAINIPHRTGYLYQPGGIVSADGHCRVFDVDAQGTIFGSGIGVVALKRLADALAERDNIYAIIKGSATNNDGASKASFTAPSVHHQTEVILEALANAGVGPETISYIEAHGTGTALGDPIEIHALTRAFRSSTSDSQFCAVGSVKSNVGHLDAAAGMAGLIKTVLALKHKQLPPSLHFRQPNPQIDFANSPFYVNSQLREWRANGSQLRAGVSSFGVGGTNAHVVLEEAPEIEPDDASREYQLIVVSARSESALEMASRNLARHLEEHAEEKLADVAYTLAVGRRRMDHRRMVVCRNVSEAVRLLESNEPRQTFSANRECLPPRLVFMFPGQGSQYLNMGRRLYEGEEEFRNQVIWCAEALKERLGVDLRHALYPPAGKEAEAEEELNETRITQPALFVVEYALARQLEKWGIKADAMIGHSLGEYVAACLAGVMRIEDALSLVSRRGELMQEAGGGGMVAVMMDEAEAEEMIKGSGLGIAAVNGPRQVVISGENREIDKLIEELGKEGRVNNKRLKTRQAYHSRMMAAAAASYVKEVEKVKLRPGRIEFISNLSGKVARAEEVTDAFYWGRQMRECVRFGEGIEELAKSPGVIFLEVGPGEVLSKLVSQSASRAANHVIIPTMGDLTETQTDSANLAMAIGKLWMAGAEIDWGGYYEGEERRKVSLPTYPFERRRHWIDPKGMVEESRHSRAGGKRKDMKEWFYVPGWERKELLRNGGSAGAEGEKKRKYIVMEGRSSVCRGLVERLIEETAEVIRVRAGESYRSVGEKEYEMRVGEKQDYEELLKEVVSEKAEVIEIVHLWGVGEDGDRQEGMQPEVGFGREQQRGFYSLLYLAQAIAELNISSPIKINVICDNLHQVSGEEKILPEKSTALAFCKVIPQEVPNFSCRSIDIVMPPSGSKEEMRLINQLVAEIAADSPDVVIALRGNRRWVHSYEHLYLEGRTQPVRPLRVNGVYLITGGLGGVGLLIAEYLARTVQARLILTGRSFFPKKNEWAHWLASHEYDDETSVKIRRLQAMEAAGAKIDVASVNITDEARMQALVANALRQYGALHGVLHAAGVTSGPSVFSPFTEISISEAESQFQPKAYGLYVLERALRNIDIDFCLLFSSNASVLGGLGLVAYSAANTFMDAFALSRGSANQFPWISAAWDPWPEETKKYIDYQTSLDQYAMSSDESVEAFNRLVTSAPEGLVVVSTGDLSARLDLWINHDREGSALETMAATTHPRSNIRGEFVAPRNKIEQDIYEIWRDILGSESVSIHDNFFFDLGGHSLLAIRIVGRLRKHFQMDIPLDKFFQSPTIAGLAKMLEAMRMEVEERQKLETLNLLSNLSDEEIDRELSDRGFDHHFGQ